MTTIVFDTEYTWAPGLERADKDGTPRIPHPPNAIVESIAYVAFDTAAVRLGTVRAATEGERVRSFVERWHKGQPRLVTFNGRGCDVPLLLARLMHHGICAPLFAGAVVGANRYRHGAHLDLYDILGGYGAQRSGGLDDWARCVGWPGKGDVDGGDVAAMLLKEGGRERVDAYCLRDAVQTAAVWLRYELTTGGMVLEEFTTRGRALVDAASADDRTAELVVKLDGSFLRPWRGMDEAEAAE